MSKSSVMYGLNLLKLKFYSKFPESHNIWSSNQELLLANTPTIPRVVTSSYYFFFLLPQYQEY